jgi:LuxR family maltose regulon positive regulatory protein
MSTPLLTTNLGIPPLCPKLVARPRLIERLNTGLHRKPALVSAPGGFGKTTLVTKSFSEARTETGSNQFQTRGMKAA